jgi:hypothetical protein
MTTYLHHLPKELLIIISSKGNYVDMEGLYFLDAKPKDEPFDDYDVSINLLEVFKLQHPYLYKVLYTKFPNSFEQINDYEEYNQWNFLLGTYHNYKTLMSDVFNYYSTRGVLPGGIKIKNVINSMFDRNYDIFLDKLFIIISLIINDDKEYQTLFRGVSDKLKLYDINLNEKELYIFKLFIYFMSNYDEYFGNYIDDSFFDINTIDKTGSYDNDYIISNDFDWYMGNFIGSRLDVLGVPEYKNVISNKRLFGIIMNIILKDTQSKGIHIDQDVLEWYNKNISK